MHTPQQQNTASSLGFRMPGEFEPMDAVWITRPRNTETWPGCFEQACEQHARFAAQLAKITRVENLGVNRDWPANDSWIRDYGPIFVTDGRGHIACHDFVFNGWGGKYNNEYADDDVVPQRVAKDMAIPCWLHDLVLEGGSIDVNGQGTVMTTAQCLLNENRNPHLSREAIEAELHAALGTRHTIWLPGGIVGDDTDGHVDDIARFVSPTTVIATRPPTGHPDFETLEKNYQTLLTARDQDGKKIEVVELPAPEPVKYNFPADRFGPGGVNPVPASYANFLIVNDTIFVPVFGQTHDDRACQIIEKTSGKSAVPIRSEFLVVGLGALHCLSQQQPRV